MAKIIEILKWAYSCSKNLVGLIGFLFLILLVSYSIVLLQGVTPAEAKLDFGMFVKSNEYAYLWCAIFVVFVIGFLITVAKSIYKGIKRGNKIAKDKSLDNQQKTNIFVKWLIRNL